MKKHFIFTILVLSLVLSGCSNVKTENENVKGNSENTEQGTQSMEQEEVVWENTEAVEQKADESEKQKEEEFKENLIKISDCYSKDESSIYYTCVPQKPNKVEGVDYDSFQVLSNGYAKDKDNIYFRAGSARKLFYYYDFDDDDDYGLVEKKYFDFDIDSFVVLDDPYYVKDDKKVVYLKFIGGSGDWLKIKEADPKTFSVIQRPYSKDKNNIYFHDFVSDIKDIDTLDFDFYFSGVYNNYAKDKFGVYYEGRKIDKADLDSFEVVMCEIMGCFAKDKNNVYNRGSVLEDADPETFEILEDYSDYERDKDHVWCGGELVEGADPTNYKPY